ncbi:hypothetical protein LPJ66_006704 [Kickxella alabastrina]|uniref:Uncharacterized protein n=1 Tax=Kickxella alabastrina TaxID=61397 RepID=A0ACC1IDD7_9FUNG|nr:hypothetical protein LPJ66_006704 [Kickxella alabastrina]
MAHAPSENIDNSRQNFMLNASRAAFNICPQLAAYFGNEFQTSSKDQHIGVNILRHMCQYCGVPLIDGRSVSRVSIVRTATRAGKSSTTKMASTVKVKAKTRSNSKRKRARQPIPATPIGRRVVNVGLNDTLFAGKPKPTGEQRLAALRDQKNSIEYVCGLCDSRVVYPGATKSNLRAAGLDDESCRAAVKLETLSLNSPKVALPSAKPVEAAASLKDTASKKQADSTSTCIVSPGPQGAAINAPKPTALPVKSRGTPAAPLPSPAAVVVAAVALKAVGKADKPAAASFDPQAMKRKRHKSNLMAAVAANKKKVEAKKAADSGAFSLNDFLSNL